MLMFALVFLFFFKQKTAYEMRISDWSSDVCSSDLILRPLAPQRAGELAIIGKVIAAIMELHAVAVPRQRHIGRMTVHPRRRQHMRLIDRHALRFVDGGGIAMIDMGIVLEVERDPPAIVEPHRHAVGGHALDMAQRAVLHAKAALVFQEHRSEEHTSELQSLMRISYAVFCLKKRKNHHKRTNQSTNTLNRLQSITKTIR